MVYVSEMTLDAGVGARLLFSPAYQQDMNSLRSELRERFGSNFSIAYTGNSKGDDVIRFYTSENSSNVLEAFGIEPPLVEYLGDQ